MKTKWIKTGANIYTLQTSQDLANLIKAIKEAVSK